jgi:hypothetical protein
MVKTGAYRAFDLAFKAMAASRASCDSKCFIEFILVHLVHDEYYTQGSGIQGAK